jgi:probable HAF family extracellular repeat protein
MVTDFYGLYPNQDIDQIGATLIEYAPDNKRAETGIQAAWIWTSSTGMLNLNNLVDSSGAGWTLNYARGINDNGLIVGFGLTPGGATHAFLLTPVPEPSTFMLGAMCLPAIWFVVYLGKRRYCGISR